MKNLLLLLVMLCSGIAAYSQTPQWVPTAGYGSVTMKSGSTPEGLSIWNGVLYFTAYDSTHGFELWSYDEITPAKLVYDFNPGHPDGARGNLVPFKGKAYINSNDGTSGMELFAFNGTPPPTKVSSLYTSGSHGPYGIFVFGSKLYFGLQTNAAYDDLYSWDGVNPIYKYPLPGYPMGSNKGCVPAGMTVYKGKLYFTAISPSNKRELYMMDTATNTASVVIGSPDFPNSAISNPVVAGNTLYFIATDATYGQEIWSYDGSAFKRLTDIAPGTKAGAWRGFAYFNGEVYFGGSADGINSQLYKINKDGAAVLVYTVNPSGNGKIHTPFVYKGNLYFVAFTSTTGNELWRYNGTTCTILADLNPGSSNGVDGSYLQYTVYKGHLYFQGSNGSHNDELYRLNDPTGIQSANWNGDVTLYPNPATASATLSITLQGAQSLKITLTDFTGREVYATSMQSFTSGKHEVILPMQSLAPGQYFYRISGNDGAMLAGGTVVKQ